MSQQNKIQLFEQKKVRTVWDAEQEKWFFAIVDVVGVLTDSVDATAYWRKLKQHADVAHQGGEVARNARLKLEQKMGQKVITPLNAKSIQKSIEDKNESE